MGVTVAVSLASRCAQVSWQGASSSEARAARPGFSGIQDVPVTESAAVLVLLVDCVIQGGETGTA